MFLIDNYSIFFNIKNQRDVIISFLNLNLEKLFNKLFLILFYLVMSFKMQQNLERKSAFSESLNEKSVDTTIKDDKLVESFRVLVKEFLEIVKIKTKIICKIKSLNLITSIAMILPYFGQIKYVF